MTLMKPALPFCALVALLLAARPAQAAFVTAYGVDSGLGGNMVLSLTAPETFAGGQFTLPLRATNTSGSQTYQDVGLAIEFVYPGNSPITGNGFNYLGGDTWQDPAATGDEAFYSAVSAPYSLVSQSLSPALIDVPLSDTEVVGPNTYTAGPLSNSDSIPLVQLGDIAPGAHDDFTLTVNSAGAGNPFFASTGIGYFVAVPEPSSLALIAFGATVLGWSLIRRPGKK